MCAYARVVHTYLLQGGYIKMTPRYTCVHRGRSDALPPGGDEKTGETLYKYVMMYFTVWMYIMCIHRGLFRSCLQCVQYTHIITHHFCCGIRWRARHHQWNFSYIEVTRDTCLNSSSYARYNARAGLRHDCTVQRSIHVYWCDVRTTKIGRRREVRVDISYTDAPLTPRA